MKTLADMIQEWQLSIVSILKGLQGYCKVRCWNWSSSWVVSSGVYCFWAELPPEARPIQARVLEEYQRLHDVLRFCCAASQMTLYEN